MLSIVHARLCGAFLSASLAMALSTATAGAATINGIEMNTASFSRTSLAAAQQARSAYYAKYTVSNAHTENFESTTDLKQTNVGSFTTLGGKGSGKSALNGGTDLALRSDSTMEWGRYVTGSSSSGKWLDSNDTYGTSWQISGVGKFNSISFYVTDAADVGAKFSIKVGDTLFSTVLGGTTKTENGNIQLVTILLPEAVTNLTVQLINSTLNDGFGVDGITVANIAPIPVPPAAALLVTGIVAMGALRRRRRTATI